MPIRGENVGTAYVRILADGSDVPDGIRDALRDSEPAMKQQGQRNAKAYQDAFDETHRKNAAGNRKKIAEGLQIGSGRMDAIAETMSNDLFDSLRTNLRNRFGGKDNTLADIIHANILGDFQKSGDFDQLLGSLEDLPNQVDRATKQVQAIERKYAADHGEALKENKARDLAVEQAYLRDVREAYAEQDRRLQFQYDAEYEHLVKTKQREAEAHYQYQRDVEQAYTEHHKEIDREFDDMVEGQVRGIDRLRDRVDKFTTTLGNNRGERRRLNIELDGILQNMNANGFSTKKYGGEVEAMRRKLNSANPLLDRFGLLLALTAERGGRLTGKGSRNNFLNFFGSLTQNLIGLVGIVPNLIGKVSNLGRAMSDAFTDAGGGISGLFKSLGPLAGAFGTLAAAGGAAALGIGALLIVLAPLAVIISSLTAIVIALAGSLAFALVGALGAVIGLLAPLSAGLGVAVAGFLALDDAQKKVLKNDLKPVTSAFGKLGDVAAKNIFANMGQQAKNLAPVIAGLEPTVRGISVAISDVGDAWISALDSDGFHRFRDEFSNVLPGMVRTLGRITSQALGGIGGIFLALIPTIQNTLRWLDDVTLRFQNWANSTKGQSELESFFERAGESVRHVGDLLGELTGLVAALFSSGKGSGDDMFQSMADNAERLTTYIKENPDAVHQWFEDGRKFAEALGRAVIEVGKLIDALDTPESRQAMRDLIDLTGKFVAALAAAGRFIDHLIHGVTNLFSGFSTGVTVAQKTVSAIVGWFQTMPPRVRAGVRGVISVTRAAFESAAQNAIARAQRIITWFQGIPGRIRGAIAPIVGVARGIFESAAQNAIARGQRIATWFQGLPGRIRGALSSIGGIIRTAFGAALDYVSGIPGRIVGYFEGLAGRILSAIGTIDIGSLIRIPDPGGGVPFVPGVASGGMFGRVTNGAMLRWVGEDGPEAIVPLDRDLNRVDPSVRLLSAIAQGKIPGMASGGTSNTGKTVNADNWTIVTSGDPVAAAHEVLNQLVATGY